MTLLSFLPRFIPNLWITGDVRVDKPSLRRPLPGRRGTSVVKPPERARLLGMLVLGLMLCVAGGLLATYTINPSFPDGAYAGMTTRSWRAVGGTVMAIGAT